jgi:predicted RNase H-like HicB family nuclease
MNANSLILKCYAERKDQQWAAFCLDFDLAVQADTLEEAKEKLHVMLAEYVNDALVGDDRQYADQLLSRRAPARMYAKCYAMSLLIQLRSLAGNIRDSFALFTEILPIKTV